jgi:hypothetical protein
MGYGGEEVARKSGLFTYACMQIVHFYDTWRRQQEAQQRQMVAAIDDQSASYKQAMSSCLQVRGYIVG